MRNAAKVAFVVLIFVSISLAESGIAAEWRLDEGSGTAINDYSGTGKSATLSDGTWVDGKFGKAIKFDGVNDYAISQSFGSGYSILTIMFWFKADSVSSGSMVDMLGQDTINSGYHHAAAFFNNSVLYGCLWNLDYTSLGSIDTNWHHMAITYDGTSAKYYLDGTLKATDTTGTRSAPANMYVALGAIDSTGCGLPGYTQQYYDGTLDEVRIYNRTLLDTEIAAHAACDYGGSGDWAINTPTFCRAKVVMNGDLTVSTNNSLVLDDAEVSFSPADKGIIVNSGALLKITGATQLTLGDASNVGYFTNNGEVSLLDGDGLLIQGGSATNKFRATGDSWKWEDSQVTIKWINFTFSSDFRPFGSFRPGAEIYTGGGGTNIEIAGDVLLGKMWQNLWVSPGDSVTLTNDASLAFPLVGHPYKGSTTGVIVIGSRTGAPNSAVFDARQGNVLWYSLIWLDDDGYFSAPDASHSFNGEGGIKMVGQEQGTFVHNQGTVTFDRAVGPNNNFRGPYYNLHLGCFYGEPNCALMLMQRDAVIENQILVDQGASMSIFGIDKVVTFGTATSSGKIINNGKTVIASSLFDPIKSTTVKAANPDYPVICEGNDPQFLDMTGMPQIAQNVILQDFDCRNNNFMTGTYGAVHVKLSGTVRFDTVNVQQVLDYPNYPNGLTALANSVLFVQGDFLVGAAAAEWTAGTGSAVVFDGGTPTVTPGLTFHHVNATNGAALYLYDTTINGNICATNGATIYLINTNVAGEVCATDTGTVTKKHDVTITVTDAYGAVVEEASVSFVDSQANPIYSGTSDVTGKVELTDVMDGVWTSAGKDNRNPHTLNASKDGVGTNSILITVDHNLVTGIVLNGEDTGYAVTGTPSTESVDDLTVKVDGEESRGPYSDTQTVQITDGDLILYEVEHDFNDGNLDIDDWIINRGENWTGISDNALPLVLYLPLIGTYCNVYSCPGITDISEPCPGGWQSVDSELYGNMCRVQVTGTVVQEGDDEIATGTIVSAPGFDIVGVIILFILGGFVLLLAASGKLSRKQG